MNRNDIHKEMEEMLGLVPAMFASIPDSTLELEWNLFKQVQMAPGAIPDKYRELMGVAVAAATKCRYCAFFHTEMAKVQGATPAEIEEAVHYAKSSMGWSTYINGMQMDFELFKDEITRVGQHVRLARQALEPGDMSE